MIDILKSCFYAVFIKVSYDWLQYFGTMTRSLELNGQF